MTPSSTDLRLALRVLAKSPGFTAFATLSLALGIGAATALFTLLNAALLRPLPGRDPAGLVTVYTSDSSGPLYGTSSYPDYLDFRARTEVFSGLAAHTLRPVLLTADGTSERAVAALVSGNLFDVLGQNAQLGRVLRADEEPPGQYPLIVLSDAFWRRRWGADPGVVGRAVALNGQPFTIVGVAAPGFTGLVRGVGVELFAPLAMSPTLGGGTLDQRGSRDLMLLGRLAPGTGIDAARASLAIVGRQLHAAHPTSWTNKRNEPRVVSVLPEHASRLLPQLRLPVTAFLGVLFALVGLVLLLACSNVASLLLARASARRRELAVRVALGASRARLLRQLLAESLLLALLSGALGVALALVASKLFGALRLPLPVTPALGLAIDGRVLLFALGVTLATQLLFGLAPAWRAAQACPSDALKGAADAPSARRRPAVRDILVTAQVAGSLVLLVVAGLLAHSLAKAHALDPGFDPRGTVVFSIDLDSRGYDAARGRVFQDALEAKLGALPGVEAVGLATRLPLTLGGGRRSLAVEGYQAAPDEDMEVDFSIVSPGYFGATRTPFVAGRGFAAADAGGPGAVVVNEAFARRFWPGRDARGRRLLVARQVAGEQREAPLEVVGVVRDGKINSVGEQPTPCVFYPLSHLYDGQTSVIVRAGGDPSALVRALRRVVGEMDPSLPVYDVRTLAAHLDTALLPMRAAAWLAALTGCVGLGLAALGLYGVLSYAVARRTREIGVRVALGARRADVVAHFLRQGLRLAGLGAGLGLLCAWGLTRFLRFLLYAVDPLDPLTLAAVSGLLLVVAAAACLVPAARAARVEPVVALRDE